VSAPEYHVAPPLACYYFSYWADVPHDGLEAYRIGRRAIFAHPTNDNLFAIFVAWPVAEQAELRADLEGAFARALDVAPEFAARVRSGRRAERLYGALHLPNFFRKPHGPGWALVGDAGHHKDPFLALGVADALRDAELLSDAVHGSLSGAEPLDQALAGYEQRRNESALPDYEVNLRMADLASPVPEQAQVMRAAVRDDPSEARRYIMALYGLIPREEFFNPENIERLMTRMRARSSHATA
jgi:2-polyprenyl-6-methoxyphenol hydroxylase-like FAD-dependent oxidoreductase